MSGPNLLGGPAAHPDDEMLCSARGCTTKARYGLLWNNPRLHTEGRRKVWLACEQHREHLATFLSARSFLRDVVSVDELDESHG